MNFDKQKDYLIDKKEELSDKLYDNSEKIYSAVGGFILGAFEESASGPDSHLENLVETASYTAGYLFLEKVMKKVFKRKSDKIHLMITGPYFFTGMMVGQTMANYVKRQVINSG